MSLSSSRFSEGHNEPDNSHANTGHHNSGLVPLDNDTGQAHSLFRNLKLNEAPCSLIWGDFNVRRRFKLDLQNGKQKALEGANIPYGSAWKPLSPEQREKAEHSFQQHMMEQYRSDHCFVC